MKQKILFAILAFISQTGLFAQNLTLEICQEKAKANYPLINQYNLIEKTASFNISNAGKNYLPQLTMTAKVSYQSDVTQIPVALGQKLGIVIPEINKDQYQAVLEATQLIWDGGLTKTQEKLTKIGAETEKQKLEVDMFALNERVNQLYFGVLLLKEQQKQTDLLMIDLQTNFNKLKALMDNGLTYQADLDALKVEILNAEQHKADLKNTIKTYYLMLSALTGLNISEKNDIIKPEIDLSVLRDSSNYRPELKLFEKQSQTIDMQKKLVVTGNLPKIGAFFQGGYGQPGLNMFLSGFSPFYIGGIRFSWNISGLYTQKNNLKKLDLNKKSVEIQKETFLFNNHLITKQQQNNIEMLLSNIENDEKIIELRQNIKKSTTAKLENGTANINDLIRDLNAENMAKQQKALHEIQLLNNIYQLKNTVNN